jgi:hypothetical protein
LGFKAGIQGLRPIAAGMAIGVAGSLAFRNLLEGLLYGVRAGNPWVMMAAWALLAPVLLALLCSGTQGHPD